jgi:Tol biopolymer transport system component
MTYQFSKKIGICFSMLVFSSTIFAQQVGAFDGRVDVGKVLHAGTASYNAETHQYKLSGSGSNIWFNHDEFSFLWKKMKGDFILQTRCSLIGKGVEEHRKYGWMIRTSLDTSSAMVCAALHGNGLTSLQYRKAHAVNVEQDTFLTRLPDVIELERKGNKFIMSVAHFGESYVTKQVSDIDLGDEVYVGLYVCAHNKNVVEQGNFSNVRIITPAKENFVPYREYIGSHIEVMNVFDGSRRIIYSVPNSIQAPNWTPDNKYLIYNSSSGLVYRLDLNTKKSEVINTDSVKSNNNDHVLSFDGKMLGLSSRTGEYNSIVYTVPAGGGVPKRITATGPSYLHGWSPDKKYLIYTGLRSGELDIYKISSSGGKEIQLTNTKGVDDGSEYSPDGKYIYFNSNRTGNMQLWRMKPDGSDQKQLTFDQYNNWFPHISPDGKWIAFLSYLNDIDPNDHPFYRHVYLRLMPISGGQPKIIAYVYGGQGSINTPSWSPDSKKIAFVSNSEIKEK